MVPMAGKGPNGLRHRDLGNRCWDPEIEYGLIRVHHAYCADELHTHTQHTLTLLYARAL